jgi:glutathione S-transferase
MYAPVATRFRTYDVRLSRTCSAYVDHIFGLPEMVEWIAAARAEPDEVQELDAEF